jgi:hypothetical protein
LHALAYLFSFLSLAAGIGLLWQRTTAAAARMLFASLLLWFLLLRVPNIVLSPTFGVFWPGFETAEMLAGAWVLYTWFAADWDRQRLSFATGKKGLRIARVLYGVALIFFGFAHFYDLKDTRLAGARLVAMAYGLGLFHGWCLHRGGRGGADRRVCTAGSRTLGITDGHVHAAGVGTHRSGWLQRRLSMESETFVSAALTASGWVVADSYRGMPPFPVDKR